MASSGNEVERWTPRQAGELAEPVMSPENDPHLSPVKSTGSTDHPLPLPGRADSAYSSFSGRSNVPEHPTASCCGECCCLPPEQVPYMDSEYVRGIYNLSAVPSELRSQHPCKAPELSTHPSPPSSSLTDRCAVPPTGGTSNQRVLPLAAPASPRVSQLDSYSITGHPGSSRGRHSAGGHSEGPVQPGVQGSQLAHKGVPQSQHWDGLTERETRPAMEKTLENKGLPSDSADEVSISNVQGLKAEENGEWSLRQQPTKRSNPHVFSRPSSFIFQEYLKTDSLVNVPKILSAYNSVHANEIPKEMNSKSYHSAHSKPSAVNDTQKVKQCPCVVQKPAARTAAVPSTMPGPSQRKGSWPCAQDLLCAPWHPDMDQDVFEDSCDLKYMKNALLNKNASRKSNSCTADNQCYDSEGKTRGHVREAVLGQQGRVQRACEAGAAEHPRHEGSDRGGTQGHGNTSQMAFFRPKEDSTAQLRCEFQKGKQANNSSPDLRTCPEQEEPPAEKHHRECPAQLSAQPWENRAGGHITRQVTPMLYYLSGGKTTDPPQPDKLTHTQEDSRSSLKEMAWSSSAASAQGPEVQRGSQQLEAPSRPHGDSADELQLQGKDLLPGSLASLTEESFNNDYREKLKVAQKKVLRETSFKRKDLQMSLPVRLRQKASKRPSIEHLRSLSLSSASEDSKPVPCSPSHLESLQSFNRDEEIRRPQMGQAGERKRVTQEEKKLCCSEPEKLDQLMDKEVSWNQIRDELTKKDTVAARRRALENGGRALSSSGISRTELKQIQHAALMEYVERKISQRPGAAQPLPLQKPPLQKRLSQPNRPPGKTSSPEGSRKMQNDEVFCQDFSREKSPNVFPAGAFVAPLSVNSKCDPSKAHGSCTSTCPSAERLPQTADPAPGRAPGRPKSIPPSTRVRQTPRARADVPAVPAPPAEDAGLSPAGAHGTEGRAAAPEPLSLPSDIPGITAPSSELWSKQHLQQLRFHDPEKDGSENHDHDDTAGHVCCQDTKELTPETSIPTPRSGSKESTGVEKECRTQSLGGNAALKHPEQGMYLHRALAQPLQGDKNPAKGLVSRDDDPLETGTHLPKRRLQCPHDQRCQELVLEIIAKDSSLMDILLPHPDRKTALDLMEGLFPVNISMLDKSHRKKGNLQHVQENDNRKSHRDGPEECPEHEAKQRSKGRGSKGNQVLNSTNYLDDITSKKLELMASLRSRLQSLWEEREHILQESRECAELGEGLEATVRDLCKPNEFERYQMFIGDLEKVVSLLLCLSSRLARVQNAMSRVDSSTDTEEKHSLSERHKLLSRQREDAKDLKENLDRRERVVSGILAKYLSEQQLQDYQHFVQVKTSLLIEQKDLEEQIKFFEEQLETLEQSLPL